MLSFDNNGSRALPNRKHTLYSHITLENNIILSYIWDALCIINASGFFLIENMVCCMLFSLYHYYRCFGICLCIFWYYCLHFAASNTFLLFYVQTNCSIVFKYVLLPGNGIKHRVSRPQRVKEKKNGN